MCPGRSMCIFPYLVVNAPPVLHVREVFGVYADAVHRHGGEEAGLGAFLNVQHAAVDNLQKKNTHTQHKHTQEGINRSGSNKQQSHHQQKNGQMWIEMD